MGSATCITNSSKHHVLFQCRLCCSPFLSIFPSVTNGCLSLFGQFLYVIERHSIDPFMTFFGIVAVPCIKLLQESDQSGRSEFFSQRLETFAPYLFECFH